MILFGNFGIISSLLETSKIFCQRKQELNAVGETCVFLPQKRTNTCFSHRVDNSGSTLGEDTHYVCTNQKKENDKTNKDEILFEVITSS